MPKALRHTTSEAKPPCFGCSAGKQDSSKIPLWCSCRGGVFVWVYYKMQKRQLRWRISSKLIFASCLGYFYGTVWNAAKRRTESLMFRVSRPFTDSAVITPVLCYVINNSRSGIFGNGGRKPGKHSSDCWGLVKIVKLYDYSKRNRQQGWCHQQTVILLNHSRGVTCLCCKALVNLLPVRSPSDNS